MTKGEFISWLNENITDNGLRQITAEKTRQGFINLADSVLFNGAFPSFSDSITPAKLTSLVYIANHNLGTNVPMLKMFDENGFSLGNEYYSARAIDDNSMEIAFYEEPVNNRIIIYKVLDSINISGQTLLKNYNFDGTWLDEGTNNYRPDEWQIIGTTSNDSRLNRFLSALPIPFLYMLAIIENFTPAQIKIKPLSNSITFTNNVTMIVKLYVTNGTVLIETNNNQFVLSANTEIQEFSYIPTNSDDLPIFSNLTDTQVHINALWFYQ